MMMMMMICSRSPNPSPSRSRSSSPIRRRRRNRRRRRSRRKPTVAEEETAAEEEQAAAAARDDDGDDDDGMIGPAAAEAAAVEPAAEEEAAAEAAAVEPAAEPAEEEPAEEPAEEQAAAAAVATVAAATVSVSIDTRIAVALRSVQPRIPEMTPGITDGIRVLSEIETVKEITTHPAFPLVARAISDAFKLDVPWTAQTRDRLVNQIKGKLPEFDDYEIMHLIRSLSYIYKVENISCGKKICNMSWNVKQAAIELEKAGITPNGIMATMRTRGELGAVDEVLLPNDDMLLGLAICQTKGIWNMIHAEPTPRRSPLLVYDLKQLASCSGVLDIYAGAGETLVDQGPGIAHAASWAYEKLSSKLNKDPSAAPPLVFNDKFLPLMKALLLSRVIAKAPLCNANDIRGLSRAKVIFEVKGYENEDLMKLLIVTHRLWTPKRMDQFVRNI